MNEIVKVCIDKIRSEDPYKKGSSGSIAGITNLMWEKGTTFRIKFLGGDPNLIERIKEKQKLWLEHANTLKFEYVNDDSANVSITFDQNDGHWSWLGKDILNNPDKEPTMNFGWPHDRDISDTEIERVAVHEMGHTLGFIHEQSSPKAEIGWNEEKVYAFYKENQGWDKDKTFFNVLQRYEEPITQYTNFDPISIMEYPIPGFLRQNGQDIIGGNKLSDMDKGFAKKHYGN